MSENKYPNSGRLANNRYKEPGSKKPDLTGEITMTREAMRQLAMEQPNGDITIKLSAWNMEGQYGPWLRLSWNNYKKPEGQGYPSQRYQQPQYQPKQQPQQRPAPQQSFPSDDDIPF